MNLPPKLSEALERALGAGLKLLAVAAASGAIVVYLVLAFVHLRHPFELEWMEGGALGQVEHLLDGKRLYVAPSLEFVPFIYTPFYFYVCAAASELFGASLFTLRLVSVLSSVGCFALIWQFVRRETGGWMAPLLSVGLLAATYRQTSAFLDLARVDSLALLLWLAGLFLLRHRDGAAWRAAAGGALVLAFLTKQSMLVAIAPMLVHALFADGLRRGAAFAVGLAASLGASVWVFDWLHDGWFNYYVFEIPSQHPKVDAMWVSYWTDDLLAPFAIAMAAATLWMLAAGPDAKDSRLFWFFAAGGALATSWGGRLHSGGWPNVLLVAYAALSVLFGFGVGLALRAGREHDATLGARLRAAAFAVASLQLVRLAYDPRPLVPSSADTRAGHAIVARIAEVDGEVWVPAHGYLATRAGKPRFAHEMAIADVVGIGGGPAGAELDRQLRDALKQRRFGAVVPTTAFLRTEIAAGYEKRRADPGFYRRKEFFPVTGVRYRPTELLLRKP